MKQYLLDEIARADLPRVREYLSEHALTSSLEDVWWVDLPEELLSPEQFEHQQCRPFRFAVELGDDFVRFEFFDPQPRDHALRLHRLRHPAAAGLHPGLRRPAGGGIVPTDLNKMVGNSAFFRSRRAGKRSASALTNWVRCTICRNIFAPLFRAARSSSRSLCWNAAGNT